MGLLRRTPRVDLRLDPPGAYRPGDELTATIAVPQPVDGVETARVELGYVNGFRHVWTGPAGDASAGNTKDGEAWVPVHEQGLPLRDGVLAPGPHSVTLELPPGAPGSSERTVRWQVRIRVERRGRDVAVVVPLTVLVAAPEPAPARRDLHLVQGTRAGQAGVLIDLTTERTCYRPGEEVRGIVGLTARTPVDRTALVAAWFQVLQISHPLDRRPPPAPAESYVPRPMIPIASGILLVEGRRTELPFVLLLPPGVDPTTVAVHSSLSWNLEVKVELSGLTGAIERARLPLVVHTA